MPWRAGLLEKTSEKNDTDVLAVLLVGGGTIAIVIGLGLLFSGNAGRVESVGIVRRLGVHRAN